MKLLLEKTGLGLRGHTHAEQQMIDDLPNGTYSAQIRKPRNVKFHRRFFSLVGMAFDMQEEFKQRDAFLDDLKIKAGFFTARKMVVPDLGEVVVLTPKSISFSSMDDLEFKTFYSQVIDVLLESYCQGHTAQEVEEAAMKYMSYT